MKTNTVIKMENFEDFVAYMGAGKAWLPIFMIEEDKQKKEGDKWRLSGQCIDMSKLTDETQRALSLMEQHKAAIFIYPNGATSDRYVESIQWHFVDIDKGDKGSKKRDMWQRIKEAPLPPTFIYRGRAGYKLLYRVTEALWDASTEESLKQSTAFFKNVQQQLIDFFGGDNAVNSPSNPLRPPFVNNFKEWSSGKVATEKLITAVTD
jgi:hypothetical protein